MDGLLPVECIEECDCPVYSETFRVRSHIVRDHHVF
jgi:hypothetical protein